jgi:RNA polymerase sigma-70 factor, ECF subfamily
MAAEQPNGAFPFSANQRRDSPIMRTMAASPSALPQPRAAAALRTADQTVPLAEARYRLVARQMRAFAGPHPELADLIQEAFTELEMANFRGQSKFSTFSHSVCYRVWLSHLRWSSRLKRKLIRALGDDVPDVPHFTTPVIELELKERYAHLYAALDRVSPLRRAVVVMHDLEGLAIADIARVVSANENTVRSRLRDGRSQLAGLLRQDPYFGDAACDPSP